MKLFLLKETILPNGGGEGCFTQLGVAPLTVGKAAQSPITQFATGLIKTTMTKVARGPKTGLGDEVFKGTLVVGALPGLDLFERKVVKLTLVGYQKIQAAIIQFPPAQGAVEDSPGGEVAVESAKLVDFPVDQSLAGDILAFVVAFIHNIHFSVLAFSCRTLIRIRLY